MTYEYKKLCGECTEANHIYTIYIYYHVFDPKCHGFGHSHSGVFIETIDLANGLSIGFKRYLNN